MIISAFNPDTKELERTYLSQYHATGVTSLAVKNNQGFATSKAILLGKQGDERSEIRTTNGVTGVGVITVSVATSFAHNADDPVYLLKWNQVKFYRATSMDGTYSVIATVDIDVDNADGVTRYDDTAGLTTSYYKVKYYNSVDTTESDFSDPIPATGMAAKTIGKVIDAVVRRVRDTDYIILSQDEYLDLANEVNDDLLMQAHKPYRFWKKKVALNTAAGVNYIDLDTAVTDFWKFNYVEYVWTTGGVTRTYKIDNPITRDAFTKKYDNGSWMDSDQLMDVAIDEEENQLMLGPAPKTTQTGAVILHYFKYPAVIDSVGDTVETPTTLIYRYKFLAEYYSAKSETDSKWGSLAVKYENKYGNEMVKMQRANRLDTGTARSFAPPIAPSYRKRFHL